MNASTAREPIYVGIDVGGTNIKAGIVTHSGKSLAKTSLPTEAERGVQHGLGVIYRTVELALTEAGLTLDDVTAIGLATPGTMDIPGGSLLEPPNLPGWWNFPIRDTVAAHFDKADPFAERRERGRVRRVLGRCRPEANSLVFWTLGTGIGCGIIIGDVIIEGEDSHGAECGHIVIDMDSHRMSAAHQYGTLEAFWREGGGVAPRGEAGDGQALEPE